MSAKEKYVRPFFLPGDGKERLIFGFRAHNQAERNVWLIFVALIMGLDQLNPVSQMVIVFSYVLATLKSLPILACFCMIFSMILWIHYL